jgi:hypothetical protein
MLILITLLFFLPMIGEQMHMNLNVVGYVIQKPVAWLLHGISWLTGV